MSWSFALWTYSYFKFISNPFDLLFISYIPNTFFQLYFFVSLFFIFYFFTNHLSLSQFLLIIILSILQGSVDDHLLRDAFLDFLSKIQFLSLHVSCGIKYSSLIYSSPSALKWTSFMSFTWLVTTFSKPNIDILDQVFFFNLWFSVYNFKKYTYKIKFYSLRLWAWKISRLKWACCGQLASC